MGMIAALFLGLAGLVHADGSMTPLAVRNRPQGGQILSTENLSAEEIRLLKEKVAAAERNRAGAAAPLTAAAQPVSDAGSQKFRGAPPADQEAPAADVPPPAGRAQPPAQQQQEEESPSGPSTLAARAGTSIRSARRAAEAMKRSFAGPDAAAGPEGARPFRRSEPERRPETDARELDAAGGPAARSPFEPSPAAASAGVLARSGSAEPILLASAGPLARRPDFHHVMPKAEHKALLGVYEATHGEHPAFRHIGVTPAQQAVGGNFVWNQGCQKVSGDCNPAAVEGTYKRNDFVAPETLKNVQKKVDGWAEYLKREEQKLDQENQEAAAAYSAPGGLRKGAGLAALESFMSGSAKALGDGAGLEPGPETAPAGSGRAQDASAAPSPAGSRFSFTTLLGRAKGLTGLAALEAPPASAEEPGPLNWPALIAAGGALTLFLGLFLVREDDDDRSHT